MNNKQNAISKLAPVLSAAVLLIAFLIIPAQTGALPLPTTPQPDDVRYIAKIDGRDFFIYSEGRWQKKFLKGVNIGVGKPGSFPGEYAITKAEYLRWFQNIRDMNAEVIRVYTTQKPEFYDALHEFNRTAKKPLYLLHGVYMREELIRILEDVHSNHSQIKQEFIADAAELIDVLHGNAKLPEQPGRASGEYKSDVSEYVIGWILGIEWDPLFVIRTNKRNPAKNNYSGKFLYTEKASPFEAFLCEVGDKVLTYEFDKYKMFRPLSFTNWLTTDIIRHPNEPFANEDKVEVNIEHIKGRSAFKPGIFASYHVYPYYPDFFNYQHSYTEFTDKSGRVNTYRAYLRDLFKQHTMPVMVAEVGIPAARGMAHVNIHSGYNQGRHDETEQGLILASLLRDIYAEGYCGALVFSWQDEWFKRVWNTMNFDLPGQRPFWSNPQANEQQFGILAFDPGKDKTACEVDGDITEWQDVSSVYASDKVTLYAKSDEKYLYLMAKTQDFDFANDSLYIAIDSLPDQGNSRDVARRLQFARPAEFLLQINGEKNSRILVDAYYDAFYYLYGVKAKVVDKKSSYHKKNQGWFNPMNLCISMELYLPQDKKYVPFRSYETGLLQYGDSNPDHPEFNSLADFNFKQGNLEIRIPWQLLNIMDPSTKTAMADFYSGKGRKVESNVPKEETFLNFDRGNVIKAQAIDGLHIGATVVRNGDKNDSTVGMGYYSWKPWTLPTYHERLKKSYPILQKTFQEIDKQETVKENAR